MKKALALFLCCVLILTFSVISFAESEENSFGAYEHVIIIGVDGAGRFFRDADTPNFDRIFENGFVDYTARAETVTVSAQNWGSIMSGVSYLRHGLTNSKAEHSERSCDIEYPTIFSYARKTFPDAELASFVNWNPINIGIIENDLNVTKFNNKDDGALTEAICDYFNAGNTPKLFFVQFDSVDHAGHDYGSKASEYLKQIETVDGYIGRIYDTLVKNDLADSSLFIVVSDHGHTVAGGHGGLTMRETNTTVAAAGKTVSADGTPDSDTRNRDVSALALYALGIRRPDHMSSRIPANVFTDVAGEKRSIKNELADTFISRLAWFITCCTAWI